MTAYRHWADKEFELDCHFQYPDRKLWFKPKGLWFEVDGDWVRWCKSDMPDWLEERYKVPYGVEFDPDKVLWLKTARDIDDFTAMYAVPLFPERLDFRSTTIAWARLTEAYAGLVIAPYCWRRRMSEHTLWYYGWDCASGCIWDLSVITKFERVEGVTDGRIAKANEEPAAG